MGPLTSRRPGTAAAQRRYRGEVAEKSPTYTVPVICFTAPSGTGKTTLLGAVIEGLTKRGYRVAAIKHDAHRIELDTEGKDSWRLRQAGAVDTVLIGENQLAWMGSPSSLPSLDVVLPLLAREADVVVVEGFRSAGFPTVLVERPEVRDPTWRRPDDDQVILTVHPDDHELVVDHLESHYLVDLDTGAEP